MHLALQQLIEEIKKTKVLFRPGDYSEMQGQLRCMNREDQLQHLFSVALKALLENARLRKENEELKRECNYMEGQLKKIRRQDPALCSRKTEMEILKKAGKYPADKKISEFKVAELRALGYSQEKVAEILNISRSTVVRKERLYEEWVRNHSKDNF